MDLALFEMFDYKNTFSLTVDCGWMDGWMEGWMDADRVLAALIATVMAVSP